MPPKSNDDKKMIQETHDKVTKVYTALVGINGQDGLIKKVDTMCAEINNNRKKIWQNRLIIFIVVVALVVSGILDSRILQLFAG